MRKYIYAQPIEEVLDQIRATIDEIKPKNLIIGCDSNAKSNVWFSKFNNKRGYYMLEFILKNDLKIMNISSEPTFLTINDQSHIDLTLTNMDSSKVNNWKVLDIETNSDHCYISFDISIQLNNQIIDSNRIGYNLVANRTESLTLKQKNKKYNIKKLNFESFEAEIEPKLTLAITKLDQIQSAEDIDSIVQTLTEDIIEVCDKTIPLKNTNRKSNSWWSRGLTEKRKFVNKLRRKFKKCKYNLIRAQRKSIYYCEKIKYQKLISESKINSWKKFCYKSQTWGLPYKISFNKLKKDTSIPNFNCRQRVHFNTKRITRFCAQQHL